MAQENAWNDENPPAEAEGNPSIGISTGSGNDPMHPARFSEEPSSPPHERSTDEVEAPDDRRANEAPKRDVLHFEQETDQEPSVQQSICPEPSVEEILFQREYCLHYKGGACNRCEIACPHSAISFDHDGWAVIDDASCTRCGICYGICDAFISSRINMTEVRSRIRRMTVFDNTLYITCSENVFSDMELAGNVLEVPCLAALPPELIASVLGEGTRVIIAGDLNYCDDCSLAGNRGEMLYMYAFQCAEQWTGKAIEFVDEVPESTGLVERMNQDSRRDAISGLLSAVGDIASGHYRTEHDSELREFEAQRAESRATAWRNEDFDHPLNQAMRKAGRFKSMFPRREFLVDMLQINPNIGSNISLTISSTDSSLCTNAHDCVASCITGARGIDDDGWLTFDSRYCIGCGICVTACRQRACSLVEITADDLSSEHVIADIEQIREARREKAVRLSDDGRKRAIDADSIYGVAEL